MNKAAELLKENVISLSNSETFKAALAFTRSFTSYSFRNTFLIYVQKPEATRVAGFKAWKKHGRMVKKGEKGISILAPMVRTEDDGTKKLFGFRSTSVFDVSQTEGDELPEVRAELQEATVDLTDASKALTRLANDNDVRVEFRPVQGKVEGYYSDAERLIVIRDDAKPTMAFTTLLHEVVHMLLHGGDDTTKKHVRELEAESTSFLVSHSLGVDTGGYSFPYLANWMSAGTPDELLKAVDRAVKVSTNIMGSIRDGQ